MTFNTPVLGMQWRAARWGAPLLLLLASLLASPAAALEVIDSSGGVIYVEVNKGRLLRLDQVPATVFLADPNIADLQFKSSKLVYVIGKATGETSLFALDRQERVLLNRKIVVGYDLHQLNASIEALIPNSAVKASMVNNTLVLDGVVGSPAEAEQVRELVKTFTGRGGNMLNRLSISMPNQVSLRVTIAEVSRSLTKELGLELQIDSPTFTFHSAVTRSFQAALEGGVTKTIGSANIAATIQALENEGLAAVLAEPVLTTVSGETASFLAGGEFPIIGSTSTGQDETTGEVTGSASIEFKTFGVSLAFTPTILDNSRISLKVRPEVSSLGTAEVVVDGQPSSTIQTRRAETTVELGNGQSMAIAGLLQRNNNLDVTKIPGLADLPILGALFKSDQFRRNETELMIVVTPYIVRPTNDRIALPTDGYQPPNDYERIMWGGMYHESSGQNPSRVATSGGQRLIGRPGFKLE